MKKILNGLLTFLLCLWQLPQECLGFYFVVFYYGRRRITKMQEYRKSYVLRIEKLKGGLSLGRFIFVNCLNWNLIKHEYGHSKQSRILGPLYLLVIGLPSLIWSLIYREKWKKSYYWFWTERWADKLGKVNREY